MRDFHLPGRSAVFAENGICATSHPLAAKTAVGILEAGGNAVDAAIAGAVLLGFCEPHMTGLGGDCFALISRPDKTVLGLNGSGRAPVAVDAEKLRQEGLSAIPLRSPHAVTIPGAVDAFCTLSETHGTLGLDRVLAPAIHYAEAGVPLAPRAAFDIQTATNSLQGHGKTHFSDQGIPLQEGQMFRAPGQAEVLRRIAKLGRDAFYTGEIAEDMCSTLTQLGGAHSMDDFAAHTSTPTDPIQGHYSGVDLLEHPPNGQGATAILMLNILKQFDIAGLDPIGADRAHLEAEAAKLAYDARDRFLADPDHTSALDHMLSMDIAEKLAALIDPKRAMQSAASLSEAVHKDTVYITVVDRDRMAVSLIYSLFHGFGSGIATEKFGILFQNRGAGFTLEAGHPNELAAGKRPMHTIIPAMLADNTGVTMPFGVMGGAYQPNGHARFVSNLRDFGMSPQQAIDAPRAFSDAGQMKVERGYSEAVRADLATRGHDVSIPDEPIGGAQAIHIRPDGILEAGSDPRKDGCAIGY